jgi:hypothetical protein
VDTTVLTIKNQDGNVGIGTVSPTDKLHVNGSLLIQHDTIYDTSSTAGWYKIGVWDPTGNNGARLKIRFLGMEGYSAQTPARGGETILYASCNNNNPSTVANMTGIIHAHGPPAITEVKFVHLDSSRHKFEIRAYVKTFVKMSMSVECNQTDSFTKFFTASSDAGVDSATVGSALFSHVFDNSGNVGIGMIDPGAKLDVNGSIRGAYDTDTTSYFGRSAVGYVGHSDWAGLAHLDCNNSTDYCLLQNNTGITELNCKSDKYIQFNCGNAAKMRMTADGDFGIGDTTPSSKLDVNGSIRGAYDTDTTSYFGRSAVGYVGHSDWAGLAHIDRNNGSDYALLQNSAGRTIINSKSDQRISFSSGDNETMCVKGSDVGIGTNSPDTILHVEAASNPQILVEDTGSANQCTIRFKTATTDWTVGQHGGETGKFKIANHTVLGTNDHITIDTSGNVGIGTSSPGCILDVALQHGEISSPMVHFRANPDGDSQGDGSVLKLENSGNRTDVELLECVSSGNTRFVVKAGGNVGIGTTSPSRKLDVHSSARPSNYPFAIGGTGTNKANYVAVTVSPGNNKTSFTKDFLLGGHSVPGFVRVHAGGSASGSGTLQYALYAEFTISVFGTNMYSNRQSGDSGISIASNGNHNGFRVTINGGTNGSYPRAWIEVYYPSNVYW